MTFSKGCIHAHILARMKKGIGPANMELALKTFLNYRAGEELEDRLHQLELVLARQDLPPSQLSNRQKAEMRNDHLADLDEIDRGTNMVDKVKEAIKWRNYIEEFVARDVGISTIHPNMNPSQWRYPFGKILKLGT